MSKAEHDDLWPVNWLSIPSTKSTKHCRGTCDIPYYEALPRDIGHPIVRSADAGQVTDGNLIVRSGQTEKGFIYVKIYICKIYIHRPICLVLEKLLLTLK